MRDYGDSIATKSSPVACTRLVTDSEQLCQAQRTSIALVLPSDLSRVARDLVRLPLLLTSGASWPRHRQGMSRLIRPPLLTICSKLRLSLIIKTPVGNCGSCSCSCLHAFCDCSVSTLKGGVFPGAETSRTADGSLCFLFNPSDFFNASDPTTNSVACSGQIKSYGVGFRPVGQCLSRRIHQDLSS